MDREPRLYSIVVWKEIESTVFASPVISKTRHSRNLQVCDCFEIRLIAGQAARAWVLPSQGLVGFLADAARPEAMWRVREAPPVDFSKLPGLALSSHRDIDCPS